KVEGNSEHPANQIVDSEGKPRKHSGTDHFAQASILSLYDPDRAQRFTKGGNEIDRQVALTALGDVSRKFSANGGEGLAVLLQRNNSPSRARLQASISQKFPKVRWYVHEAVELNLPQQAATIAFGQSVTPVYRLD